MRRVEGLRAGLLCGLAPMSVSRVGIRMVAALLYHSTERPVNYNLPERYHYQTPPHAVAALTHRAVAVSGRWSAARNHPSC